MFSPHGAKRGNPVTFGVKTSARNVKLRMYLDTRYGDAPYPVRLGISRGGRTAYITLSVRLYPEQWDSENQRPRRMPASRWAQCGQVTNYLDRRRTEIENRLLRLEANGELHRLTALQIRDILQRDESEQECVPLSELFERVAASHDNPRTQEIYRTTWRKITDIMPDADTLTAESITAEWLDTFNRTMQKKGTPTQNARNVHLRNLRAVMNYAVGEELTTNYPFRRYKLHSTETVKRSVTSADLRRIINAPCDGFMQEYRDIFALSVCLIGINITDLCDLRHDNLQGDRLQYRRAKTGHLYDIKIEPETRALLDKYKGHDWLLCIRDRYKSPRDYTQHINAGLKRLIPEPPFNKLSTYWARHSWATIAFNELGASVETISAALGHRYGSRITAIYINPDTRKVDELNRQLLDLLFN